MTLFHTMGPNRNVLFQTHLLFVTIYGLMWSSFINICHWLCDITLSSNEIYCTNKEGNCKCIGKLCCQQECIPVGCIPPTAVAVSPAMHPTLMHAPSPCYAHPMPYMPHAMHAPMPCMPHAMHAPMPSMPPFHACPMPCMPPAMHASLPCTPPAMHTPCHACPTLPCMPPCGQTDTCENITFTNFVCGW